MESRHAACVAVLTAAILANTCGGSSADTPSAPTAQLPAMSLMLSEKALGNPTAPVTMIEYSSLGCSHCADFHASTLPTLKANYIDTGRMRLIFRDYPIGDAAMAGAMLARCSGDAYFATLEALFRSQSSWAYTSDYKAGLINVVAGLGMTSNDVEACLASTELRNGVLALRQGGAQNYGVNSTPTFFINGRTVIGAYPYAHFAAIIDSF